MYAFLYIIEVLDCTPMSKEYLYKFGIPECTYCNWDPLYKFGILESIFNIRYTNIICTYRTFKIYCFR